MATNMMQASSFYERAYEHLLEEMYSKDDLVVKLGDTLDVKASILLAAITLLATQTAYFLDKQTPGVAHYLLLCAAILLAISTGLAFAELWPRTFLMPAPETSGISRASELHAFYSQHEGVSAETMLAEFTKNEIGWVQQRIAKNQSINKSKSIYLEWSFYCVVVAMGLNMTVLLMRLF